MLNILQKNNLCSVLVVVTRYFGGILLGTGGLVRAYSDATQKAIEKMKEMDINVISCDALSLALDAGNAKAVNVVLIGLLAKNSPIPKEVWEEALESTVPAKFLDVNKKAFSAGYCANA